MNIFKFGAALSMLGLANAALLYVDPGVFGQIAQIGYLVLFAALSAILFLFKPIKALLQRLRGGRPQRDTPDPESDNESNKS